MERETRFLLLSLLLIVLPSLLLSYFGLKAIQKESQTLEIQFRKTVGRLAGEISTDIDQAIRHQESPLRQLLQSVPGKTDPIEVAGVFRAAASDSDYLGEVHLIDRQGGTLTLASAATPRGKVLTQDIRLLRAERLETAGQLDSALARYTEMAGETTLAPRRRASALLGRARCLDKLRRRPEAILSLRKLIQEYPLAADHSTGLVLSLGARRRLAEIQQENGQPLAETAEWLELLTFIENRRLQIPTELAASYRRRADEALQGLLGPEGGSPPAGAEQAAERWRQLLAQAREAETQSQRLRELVAQLTPTVARALDGDLPRVGHVDIPGKQGRQFFFYGPLRTRQGATSLVFVEVHPAQVVNDILPRYRARHPELEPVIRDLEQRPLAPVSLSNWTLLEERPISSIPLKTTIWFRGPDPSARYSAVQTRSFVWVIALALIGILLGCFVILRAVTRELKLARQKSDFVSNVTHELKTPLTSIRMFVETLQMGRFHSDDDRQECLDRIERETARLQRLIERVLEFSKIDRGVKTFDFRRNDPNTCLDQAVLLFAAEHGTGSYDLIQQRSEDLPFARCDLEAVVEVLLNLLQNAYKYSDPPHEITLGASAEDGELRLWVGDQGIGIAPNQQKKIFRKFYRVDDVLARRADGAGLGLTLCAAIVRAHHGRVTLESSPGQGSLFTIFLPLTGPEGETREGQPILSEAT